MPLTLVSGGQSGVDRAALDAALTRGLGAGGWCPKGRWAEDGPVPSRYPLRETASADPAERTRLNVRDTDGTLVLAPAPAEGGTLLTIQVARALSRPHRVLDPSVADPASAADWVRAEAIGRLNVAGPRESEVPGIYRAASNWLGRMLDLLSPGR